MICCLSYCRKSIYKGMINVIHFNLALSLLIGLIIFVSSVDNAKNNEVRFLLML